MRFGKHVLENVREIMMLLRSTSPLIFKNIIKVFLHWNFWVMEFGLDFVSNKLKWRIRADFVISIINLHLRYGNEIFRALKRASLKCANYSNNCYHWDHNVNKQRSLFFLSFCQSNFWWIPWFQLISSLIREFSEARGTNDFLYFFLSVLQLQLMLQPESPGFDHSLNQKLQDSFSG